MFGRRWRIEASTSRTADLYQSNGQGDLDGTVTLKELREFVKHLEHWPDKAKVKPLRGAILRVTHWEDADTMEGADDE